jgi:hypothetical protein
MLKKYRLLWIRSIILTDAINAYKYLHLGSAPTEPYRPVRPQSVVHQTDLGHFDIKRDLIPSRSIYQAQLRTLLRQYLVLVLPGIGRVSVGKIDDGCRHRAVARALVA